MKKLLLASVASFAVAAFAAGQAHADSTTYSTTSTTTTSSYSATSGLKLGLGGYFTVQGGYAQQSDGVNQPGRGVQKTDVFEYGELHFSAEKSFDNGLTAGYRAVLELPVSTSAPSASTTSGSPVAGGPEIALPGSPTVAIRQDYGYFSGNWGRFEAGQNYSPVYYMAVTAPAVNDEFDSIDPDLKLVDITSSIAINGTGYTGTGVASTTAAGNKAFTFGQLSTVGNYATVGMTPFYKTGGMLGDKIVYYTPRFNGFQLGADYQPDQDRTGDTVKSATSGFVYDQASYQQTDRAEVGAAYDGKFAGFGVKLGGGYAHGDAGTQIANSSNQLKDEQAWTGGAQLSYLNWTLGGGYLWDNNGQSFSATTETGNGAGGRTINTITADGETNTWNAGLGYAIGPYHAGVSYYNSQIDVLRSNGGTVGAAGTFAAYKSNDKLDRWVVGGGYSVAPGVDLNSTLQFDKYSTADSALNPAGNNNATVFTVGTTVNF